MKFKNVLYFEVQSCNFWGKGYNLLGWELVDEKKILESLYQRGNNLKASHFNTTLEGTSYFVTKFLLNSGDEILIYCEKIFVEEKVNN